MKTVYFSATVIGITYLMMLISTVPRVSGQFLPRFYTSQENANGLGALLLGILLLGTLFLNPFQNGRNGTKLSVTNEGNTANRANSSSKADGISEAFAYILA
ncbi:hypothetical protein CHS0354_017079 [Potamilus streckersoni]|uniref:Uncharacterized protein n=1 Tax=Potamilus streckersoni TaxID=2493646 RepID=A0AAE0SBU2_9BIVA|nr:hypothetical protein CHS0354_017079 [Potamilus streckersoni]